MTKRILVLLALMVGAGVAHAQPVPVTWRPPTTCSDGQLLQWSTAQGKWVCGTATSFSTNNVIPKGNGTGLTASSWTDSGTVSATTGIVNITGGGSSRFVYLDSLGTNYGVIYDSGGKMRFGGAATVGGAPSIASFEIDPNSAAATALGTLTSTGDFAVGASKFTVTASNGATDVAGYVAVDTLFAHSGGGTAVNVGAGGGLTVEKSVAAYTTLSGAANVSGALAAGNSVGSTTAADIGWGVGLDRSGGSVYLDTKLGTGASLVGRIGSGTTSGQTNVYWQVDGSGNATLPKNVTHGSSTANNHIALGNTAMIETTGTTFSTIDPGGAAVRTRDDTSMAQGVGGGVLFEGAYSGSTVIGGGGIKLMKSNGKTGDLDFDLALGTRRNTTGNLNERLRIDATGATNALGQMVGVGGTHASIYAADMTDAFYAGYIRKNLSKNSRKAGDDTATDGNWRHVNGTATLVYTTSSQTSPAGIAEFVGQITCTGATCSSSGADYRLVETSTSTTIEDIRSLTFTLSVWVKTASGTNTAFALGLGRYNDNDSGTTTCTVNNTTWTRCSYTRTFSATSLTDNSELRAYLYPQNTTTHYLFGAQIEAGSDPTPWEETSGTLGSGAFTIQNGGTVATNSTAGGGALDTAFGIWSESLAIGVPFSTGIPSPQTAPFYVGPYGDVSAQTGAFTFLTSTFGGNFSGTTTFNNGPVGVNNYAGTHLEWANEWLWTFGSAITATSWAGMSIGGIYSIEGTGTGAALANGAAASGRPGITDLTTGTTATGATDVIGNKSSVNFADGNWTHEATVLFTTLSTVSEEYSFQFGFLDAESSANQTDGCYFEYDRVGTATDPGTGDATGTPGDNWQIWCASNGTRTGYILNTTSVAQDSFARVVSTVAAATWYRLKIVMEGTSKARFYINGTEVGRITTNIPSGTSRVSAPGFQIVKSAGTTARTVSVDQTRLAVDLTSARSP